MAVSGQGDVVISEYFVAIMAFRSSRNYSVAGTGCYPLGTKAVARPLDEAFSKKFRELLYAVAWR
jgi:hypothetical protein